MKLKGGAGKVRRVVMKATGPIGIAYARLAVSQVDAAASFASDILGLQPVQAADGSRIFRSDHRKHTLTLNADGASSCAIEVANSEDLDAIHERMRNEEFEARWATDEECQARYVRRALLAKDTSGFPIDLVFAPAHSGRRFYGARDAGVKGLHSLGLRSTDLERDLLLWTRVIGGRERDRVGQIVYLGLDSAHHRLALYPSTNSGLLYVTFEVESFDCVMQSFYHLQDHQVRILQGPGRETASGQHFVRFEGPDRHMFAFGHGMSKVDEERHRPRQFDLDRFSLCGWGSECEETPELSAI